jgi:hypothetical protein
MGPKVIYVCITPIKALPYKNIVFKEFPIKNIVLRKPMFLSSIKLTASI